MTSRSEEIELRGNTQDATRAINETGDAVDDLDKGLGKVEKSSDRAKKKTDELSKTMATSAQSLGVVAAAAALLVARYAEVDAAQGRLTASVNAAGGTQADHKALTDASAAAMRRFGVDTLTSAKMQDVLINASGDAKTALGDYKLALDVAAGAGLSVEDAANRIAKARRGEIDGLKDLRGFNKELADDLMTVQDETERTRLATELLAAAYDGAAEETDGLATSIDVMKAQLLDTATNSGDVLAAFGAMGTEFLRVFGILEDGASFVEQFSSGLKGFAGAIRETTDFVAVIPNAFAKWRDEEGSFGAAFLEEVSKRDTARAKSAAVAKDTSEETREAAMEQVQGEIKAAAEEVKVEQTRAKARSNALAQRKRDEEAAQKAREQAAKEAEERDFREELARLKLRGEARAALEMELARGNATESERALALGAFDEQLAKIERERELREEIAQLQLAGNDYAAARLEILAQELTETEQLLALRQLDAETAATADAKQKKDRQEQIALANAYGQAIRSAATGVLEAAGLSEGAKRAGAAIDAAIAGYNAVMAYAAFNIPSGIQYTVAAGMAAKVAGTSAPATQSGGSSAPTPSASPQLTRAEQGVSNVGIETGPRVLQQNLYLRTNSWTSPEDARRNMEAEFREVESTIGGGA